MFDWKAWGIDTDTPNLPTKETHSDAHKPHAGQAVQPQQTDQPTPVAGQIGGNPAVLTEPQAQALFLLHECVLIEEDRRRQAIFKVWVNLTDWQQLCCDRLKWSVADCTDHLLALKTANRVQQHASGRAIRPI